MSLLLKKRRERFLAQEAAQLLGETWDFGPDRESPDFIVTAQGRRFGLEISEIFTGGQGPAGSALRRMESRTHQAIENLRYEYEAIANIPLTVKFVGNLNAKNMAMVVPALLAEALENKPALHHFVFDTGEGLRVHATKALRPDWFSVNDRVGWVDRDPMPRIADAIAQKSGKLGEYKSAAGPDIRLLLIADRFSNSGKLRLESSPPLNLLGFRIVYFYSRPEVVTVFDDSGQWA